MAMKSPMIEAMPYLLPKTPEMRSAVSNRYTELQVLRSGAGYYIGTLYEEFDAIGKVVWQEPGSRDSDYFRTEEGAAAYLKVIEAGSDEDAATALRQHP
jgi:hypothetical protein